MSLLEPFYMYIYQLLNQISLSEIALLGNPLEMTGKLYII